MSKTVYAVGDCAANASGGSSLNRSCKALVPSAGSLDQFWFLGDVYTDGTNAQFTNDFDPLWGSYKTAGKLYSTPGNHGWANHTTGFDVYHNALITSWGGKHYGSYTLGDWIIIWINSMEGAATSVSPVPESSIVLNQSSGPAHDMLTWLQGIFTANPGTNKIVICHHNIWASGGHNDISQMQPLWQMLPGNAAVVLTGHTHNMEVHQPRNKAGSVVAFNNGAGAGGSGATIAVLCALAGNTDALDPSYTPAPTYATAASPGKAGVLKIVLSDTGLANPTADLTFLATDGTTHAIPTITSNASTSSGATPPSNTTPPTISDTTPVVGQLLTTSGGIWTGSPTPTLTYQWQVSATGTGTWSNATGTGNATNSYTVASADNGKFLRVQVTATNSGGTAAANSAATSAVASAPAVPVETAQPVVTDGAGNNPPIVGDVLTTTNGSWSNSPSSFTRAWQRRDPTTGTVTTTGATGTTYTLTTDDLGFQIRSRITATNGTGASDPAPSAWTATVSAPDSGLQPGVTQAGGVYTVEVALDAPAIGLTATLDQVNARVELLVNMPGMANVTITRTHPSGQVWTVRGINQAPTAGDVFLGYDYELPIGRDCVYVAEAWDADGNDLGASLGQDIVWNTDQEYLKDPAMPARNLPVRISAMTEGDFTAPLTVLPVIGRPAPITLGDVRQAQTGDLGLLTLTLDEALRLHQLTASGNVLLLQATPGSEVGNMYIALSQVTETRVSPLRDEPARQWTLSYQETDPPIGGISGGFPTYQTILDDEESYQDILDDFDSYLTMLQDAGATAPPPPDIVWRGA